MCSRHAEYGAGYDITDATMDYLQNTRAPFAPTRMGTCPWCGCNFKAFDISGPNPVEDLCLEPLGRFGCDCHSKAFVEGFLDERDRMREETVGTL